MTKLKKNSEQANDSDTFESDNDSDIESDRKDISLGRETDSNSTTISNRSKKEGKSVERNDLEDLKEIEQQKMVNEDATESDAIKDSKKKN